jgi:SAM-dependent methyltransferase
MMILDIGSGYMLWHRSRGSVNVDIMKPAVKPDNFVRCDAHFLPFKLEVFDAAFMFEVAYYLRSPLDVMLEIARVLKKNGRLMVSVMNPTHWRRVLMEARGGHVDICNDTQIQCWTEVELKALFRSAGFKPGDAEYFIWDLPKGLKDHRTHIELDTVLYGFLPRSLGGRNMMMKGVKTG